MSSADEDSLSIAAVERDTGLAKDTLRVWERRYGFPAPWRDANGERRYPQAQVERLRLVARLLASGLRPGEVLPLPLGALKATAIKVCGQRSASLASGNAPPNLSDLMAAVRDGDAVGLWRSLAEVQSRLGPSRFVTELVVSLNAAVGEGWLSGSVQIHEEHLYTEVVQSLMRQALMGMPAPPPHAAPRVLLTTLPGEPHGLGLLMAQTLLALEGCACVSLGLQTPVTETVAAAAVHGADIVALSCSGFMAPADLLGALASLRLGLAPSTEVWVGGKTPVLQRRALEGVRPVAALESIAAEVKRWREQAASRVAMATG